MTILKCSDITVMYEKQIAVNKVSFEIDKGDYICIVGENGTGKSTLMKAVLGLLPVKSGKIEFVNGLSRKKISYLPQQTMIQKDFPASVFEVVMSGRISSKGVFAFYGRKDKDAAEDYLKKLDIINLKNKSYKELSGGQQQRVLLARALCAEAKVLFLDEPVSGLDAAACHEMYEIIKKLNEEDDLSIVMISHDIKSAVRYANKILHMNTDLLFFGSVKNYIDSEYCKILND